VRVNQTYRIRYFNSQRFENADFSPLRSEVKMRVERQSA